MFILFVKLKNFIKTLKRKIVKSSIQLIEQFLSKKRWTSSIYYSLFSSSMNFEHQSVLHGKIKYNNSSSFLLRRNTHRLEKGLIMRPRRAIFARDYIEETVIAFSEINKKNKNKINNETKWSYDVLKEFFSVVEKDTLLDKQREEFEKNIIENKYNDQTPSIPYIRNHNSKQVDIEQLLNLANIRRSVRWFTHEKVPRNLVDKAILVAAQSPSACNRQPFEFKIFDNPELVSKISKIPMGTKGFSHQFPMIIVVVGDLSAYFSERDRHIIYIDASLASMGLLYGLETQGLSSCVINWPEIKEKEIELANTISLEKHERPIFLIAVGWPDKEGMVPYSQKKCLNQIRSYN